MRAGNTEFEDIYKGQFAAPYYIIEYTTTSGETIRKMIPCEEFKVRDDPEIEAGDISVLDNFLKGFDNAKE